MWPDFLESFHRERPGITEQVIGRSQAGDLTPYQWLVEAIPTSGEVIDIACGNGPLAALVGSRWCGADLSMSELALGVTTHASRQVVAEAAALPFPNAAVDIVICSMALQVLEPLSMVVAEIARVLRPGGLFVGIVPARHPLTIRDRWRYVGLIRTLHRGFATPNDRALARPADVMNSAGFDLLSDESRRFEYPIERPAQAEAFVSSLYLHDVTTAQVAAAATMARRWVGTSLGIPIRRIVCHRQTG